MPAAVQAQASCSSVEEVGSTGVGALTIDFIILAAASFIFVYKLSEAANKKVAYLCIYICGISAIAYYAMLAGQGWSAGTTCRQFFYARYIDWILTWPLITILLALIAGCEWTPVLGAIGGQVVQVFAQYMASVSVLDTVKWFWFLIEICGLMFLVFHVTRIFKATAENKGGEAAVLYNKVAWTTVIVWICYPILWLFADGFSSFTVSFEVTMYAILDLINKVLLCFMVVSAQDSIGNDDNTAGTREYV
ncbi:hypothetical protein GUITHDRAFT_145279 [Guillardia theta CCMP2712]|uniref:Uncharacterized protein n=1 Tax=Guillardia theta (strain CCMP2712) TaxID=905079 RepID=L1IMK0_GUITC|nr:hypothetical protein GUITHDRAFT_145279 [Guillardia theta CCMP2712]EKX37035.1 hypothetical protein GUITHDRAFT_145279 [Guillardia theta CCMP2712]|eukprot:XP_005824015.1 hypothetical protein GUITHDRAFT_145279 [Guillardia theta CCMP2712]